MALNNCVDFYPKDPNIVHTGVFLTHYADNQNKLRGNNDFCSCYDQYEILSGCESYTDPSIYLAQSNWSGVLSGNVAMHEGGLESLSVDVHFGGTIASNPSWLSLMVTDPNGNSAYVGLYQEGWLGSTHLGTWDDVIGPPDASWDVEIWLSSVNLVNEIDFSSANLYGSGTWTVAWNMVRVDLLFQSSLRLTLQLNGLHPQADGDWSNSRVALPSGIHGLVTVTQSPFPWALKRPVESVYWWGEFASNWHLETPGLFWPYHHQTYEVADFGFSSYVVKSVIGGANTTLYNSNV